MQCAVAPAKTGKYSSYVTSHAVYPLSSIGFVIILFNGRDYNFYVKNSMKKIGRSRSFAPFNVFKGKIFNKKIQNGSSGLHKKICVLNPLRWCEVEGTN
jgi:hypothetical protein